MPNGEPGHSGRAGRARGIGLRVWQEYNALYLESVVPSVIPEKPRRIVQHLAFLLPRPRGIPCRFADVVNLAQLVERHPVQRTYGWTGPVVGSVLRVAAPAPPAASLKLGRCISSAQGPTNSAGEYPFNKLALPGIHVAVSVLH